MPDDVVCPECGCAEPAEAFGAEDSEGMVLSCPECGHTDLGEEFGRCAS